MHPTWQPFFGLIGAIVLLWGWASIFSKAGYSGWLTLLWLVPIANIVLFIWFAFFAKWRGVRTD